MARKVLPFSNDLSRLNKKEAAARLGVCLLRVNTWIEQGELVMVATAPGVRARILESSVDAMLARINSAATCVA